MEVFKKLQINIPFAEALEQMPSYVKFMKEILSKKRNLTDFKTITLTEECSAVIQSNLSPKLKDPGSFTIPYMIGNQFMGKTLCDLGANINLMPYSMCKKMGLKAIKPTNVTLQLADRSLAYPKGIIEDVLVKVDKFIFLADFVVLDFEEYKEIPLILRRPFLATGRTVIDLQNGELTMSVNNEEIKFNISQVVKFADDVEDCYLVEEAKTSADESGYKSEGPKNGMRSNGYSKEVEKEQNKISGNEMEWEAEPSNPDIPDKVK